MSSHQLLLLPKQVGRGSMVRKSAPIRLLTALASQRPPSESIIIATTRRSFNAAAATKREKRAIDLEQLTQQASPPSSGGGVASTPTPKAPSGGVGVDPMMMIGAIAGIGAGGIYYYYNFMKADGTSSTTASTPEIIEEKPAVVVSMENKAETEDATEKSAAVEPAVVETSSPSTDSNGHRVRQIHTYQNKASSTAAVPSEPQHPVDGNRVTMLIPATNDKSTTKNGNITDTLMTDDAIRDLRTSMLEKAFSELLAVSQKAGNTGDLRTDTSLCTTLESCQLRIIQLYSELKDRTSYEALRLKEFLYHHEKDISQKYIELLQKQRLEYENLLQSKLREQENELLRQMNHALQEKDGTIHQMIQSALDVQKHEHEIDKQAYHETLQKEIQYNYDNEYNAKLEDYKTNVQNELQKKVQTLQQLQEQLHVLQNALMMYQVSQEGSHKAHRLSAAALAFAEKLETSDSAGMELKTLQSVSGKDGVIVTALSTIPDDAVQRGIPTTMNLQQRFRNDIYPQCRYATNIPSGRIGTLEGQLAGRFFSMLKYPTSPSVVVVDDDDKYNPEHIIERAKHYIEDGQIEFALQELDQMEGASSSDQQRKQLLSVLLSDWKQDAIHRITIDKALKVIKMECALLNESCL